MLLGFILDGELRNGSDINGLNSTLKILATAHADEYDSNLNGMSAKDLINRFKGERTENLENDKEELSRETFTNNGYTVVKIPDFETSSKYSKYTDWCVTRYENMYEHYTGGGSGLFYFFLKDGFENVQRIEG